YHPTVRTLLPVRTLSPGRMLSLARIRSFVPMLSPVSPPPLVERESPLLGRSGRVPCWGGAGESLVGEERESPLLGRSGAGESLDGDWIGGGWMVGGSVKFVFLLLVRET